MRQHKNATKTSITQQYRTDLGRSVGVTIATQLVWFNRFTGSQSSHVQEQQQRSILTSAIVVFEAAVCLRTQVFGKPDLH